MTQLPNFSPGFVTSYMPQGTSVFMSPVYNAQRQQTHEHLQQYHQLQGSPQFSSSAHFNMNLNVKNGSFDQANDPKNNPMFVVPSYETMAPVSSIDYALELEKNHSSRFQTYDHNNHNYYEQFSSTIDYNQNGQSTSGPLNDGTAISTPVPIPSAAFVTSNFPQANNSNSNHVPLTSFNRDEFENSEQLAIPYNQMAWQNLSTGQANGEHFKIQQHPIINQSLSNVEPTQDWYSAASVQSNPPLLQWSIPFTTNRSEKTGSITTEHDNFSCSTTNYSTSNKTYSSSRSKSRRGLRKSNGDSETKPYSHEEFERSEQRRLRNNLACRESRQRRKLRANAMQKMLDDLNVDNIKLRDTYSELTSKCNELICRAMQIIDLNKDKLHQPHFQQLLKFINSKK